MFMDIPDLVLYDCTRTTPFLLKTYNDITGLFFAKVRVLAMEFMLFDQDFV
jgi:hypothetical protein